MMAVHKATRSNSAPQTNNKTKLPDHQRRAEFFETLRHLNRGYGVALAALDRLELKDCHRPRPIFPASLWQDYRTRTEGLQALANHDLLLVFAGREEHEAGRFNQLSAQAAKRLCKRRS
jgi:hypothetical protein